MRFATAASWPDRFATYRANAGREAIRQLAELRTRLDAAEEALHAAYANRKQARRNRYAARQAYERASAAVERLQRQVS